MIPQKKTYNISSSNITELLTVHYAGLMPAFYESQSTFLCDLYKKYGSIETANVMLCFTRNVHLEIIRQREKDLNFNVSAEKFWNNFSNIEKPREKITQIVKITGIPKETVRRKINKLIELDFLSRDKKDKGYYWNLSPKGIAAYIKIIEAQTENLAKFIAKITKCLNLDFDVKTVKNEIKSQFSFYWYHYLSCQIDWLKMWQLKLKDNELILIALQSTIPTLQYIDKNVGHINLENVYKIIGHINKKDEENNCSVGATSVSDVTGIPRATCIRKLEKLVNLGFLIHRDKNKRYVVNQISDGSTKNIMKKENVSDTIKTFSEYIAIILNSLIHNKQ